MIRMKIRKRNLLTWFFFFVVIALENFSWLIPSGDYIVTGLLKYSDIGVLAALTFVLIVWFKFKTIIHKKYSILLFTFIILIIVSSFPAAHFFGQSIQLSIRQNRYMIVCILLYYALLTCIDREIITEEDVIKVICFQAIIEILVFALQYILIDKITFVYTGIGERYGAARLRVPFLMSMIFMYYCINNILKNKRIVLNCFGALGGVMVLAVICKHRAPTIILLGTFVIAFILWKGGTGNKVVLGILAIGISFFILSNSTIINDVIDTVFVQKGHNSTLTIREEGHMYYLARLIQSPFLGFGIPNDNCIAAQYAAGFQYNYLLADNGIYGFLYSFGIIGLIWLALFWFSLYKQAIFLYIYKRQYWFLLYVIFETGNLYMGMHWYYYYMLPFILILALMNIEYREAKMLEKVGRRRG